MEPVQAFGVSIRIIGLLVCLAAILYLRTLAKMTLQKA
jgi:hypothetical protein